jgi:hypothetical protein
MSVDLLQVTQKLMPHPALPQGSTIDDFTAWCEKHLPFTGSSNFFVADDILANVVGRLKTTTPLDEACLTYFRDQLKDKDGDFEFLISA